jgi:type I restriction enzyme S subunit
MTTAQFFEKFDLIAHAPDAVAKMRSLILELAVRGQLTSASPQPSASSDPSASPFPIPQDWRWVALREVAAPCGQKKPDARFTYIDVGAIDNQRGLISANAEVVEAAKAPSRARKIVRSGCVIYATVRPYLRNIAIVTREFDPPAIASTAFAVLMPEKVLDEQFLFYWLRCASFQDIVSSKMKGVAYPAISDTEFWQCPIPLPPLAEQMRIVAKVDELMALCDQLEAQQQERETKHTALAQATLDRFAEDPTQTNLNLLFHSSFSIQPSDLRKTILTLAVQGKLVPQDPNDEPAEEILARIAATKLRLQRTGEIGKEKLVEPLQPDSLPFKAPDSWRWAKLAELTELITKGSSPKWQGIAYVLESEGILFITSENVGNYVLKKLDDLKYVSKGFNEIEPRSILKRGDILMNLVGASIGRTAVYDLHDGANINQAVALIRLVRETDGVCPRFLLHYLNSPSAIDYMLASRVVNAQPNISLTDAREFTVPIPPLAEQKRIAAKVEELMALVDALEAQQAAADQAATNLLDAVVSELAAAA